ncbi:hypothetical protein BABINDRAFT_170062 [Babjeviella inositovora NRRL Y-12698]|uniref:Uncharacterized protein n=1 Tax=Babjeviella inositovora NRRL Y-12698 TaxID=984486 RepID=A0A1E3QZK6_9ASCO|nr:uncharacterized protein BABINDRAFT_170062 [Babjeviella inositovora NRRL Y-12698]ODQ82974.1 hypothetical protein BABINDRAFT_170062 [Babjeviella inositovora NRRL Y-12698]
MTWLNSCGSTNPIAGDGTANAFNPCFLLLCLVGFAVTFLVCGLWQMVQMYAHERVGHTFTIRSVGVLQFVRLSLVFLQATLYLVLASASSTFDIRLVGFLAMGLVLLAVILPLHMMEPTRAVVPAGTNLFFWLLSTALQLVLVLQESLTDWPLIEGSTFASIHGLLLVNACHILYLEHFQWMPSRELREYYTYNALEPELNIFQKITFSWMNELIHKGYTQDSLKLDDLPNPPQAMLIDPSARKVSRAWFNEYNRKIKARATPSLLIVLVKVFGVPILVAGTFELADCVISFAQPLLLRRLIQFANDAEAPPIIIGLLISVGMFTVSVILTTVYNIFFIKIFEVALSCKSGLMALLYAKALRLSPDARLEKKTGDVINLLSVDVSRVQDMSQQFQMLISAPVKLVLCLMALYSLLGNATMGGIVVMVVLIPLSAGLMRSMKSLHKTQMKFKDTRTSIMTEILSLIKSIKLYAWEKPMLDKLDDARNVKELGNLQKIGIFGACTGFAWNCAPFLVSCSSFAIFAATQDRPLSPDIVFPALSLFNILSEPLFALPAVFTAMIETSVSLARLQEFLLLGEIDPVAVQYAPKAERMGEQAVTISNAKFLWSNDESKVALDAVDFSANKGELACIIGRVGSGKSTFLQALLGELIVAGADGVNPAKIAISGSIAYCPQVPWVMNATVKENILFGCRYDADFYAQTLAACALLPDIEILPDGDETQVGEKGISLSGGQKARLSLARAVYSRLDVYLMDDILSAVDAHVGKHITEHVLSSSGLLCSKTKILATNSVSVLAIADDILLLIGGKTVERGSLDEVMAKKGEVYELINEYGGELELELVKLAKLAEHSPGVEHSSEADTAPRLSSEAPDMMELPNHSPESDWLGELVDTSHGVPLLRKLSHTTLRRASMASFTKLPPNGDAPKRRTAQLAEVSAKGKVKWSVYFAYARACSVPGVILLFTMMILTTAISVASNFWLKHWSEENARHGSNTDVWRNVGMYAVLGIGSSLATLVRQIVMWCFCSIRASRELHDRMARAVMRSPMSFFETTPIGRVMNRFSQDMNRVDEGLPRIFAGFFTSCIRAAFTLLVVVSAMPSFAVIVLLLMVVYIYYQMMYIATSRELKRIVTVTHSPIFAHLQETLNGVDTVRAYKQEARFKFLNYTNIDFYLKASYVFRSINRWLSFRLQLLGSIIIFAASIAVLYSLTTASPLSSGMVGLVMSYALQVTGSLNFIVRLSVEVETRVVCVERILEYCELSPEAPAVVEGKRPVHNWPAQGSVRFDHYTTKYRANLDPVLLNISLEIRPREKVGIVGRTGAGKSTFALAIFRLIEPTEGYVLIDGLNTSEMGLFDLRSKLSIIPQDSQAFEGTVRQNLDPLQRHTDDELWNVLRLSHLEAHIRSMGDGLMSKVAEGGSNLSVGQRQLMCLGRALLNDSKVLILDEATAAVDVQTDKIVQETIRTEFNDRTILTIAHRLDTVMDSDRIMVLDKGEVKEFAPPAELLADKSSLFYSLCEQGGYLKNESEVSLAV